MKFLFTLVVLIFGVPMNPVEAQVNSYPVKATPAICLNPEITINTSNTPFKHHCLASLRVGDEPLLVINGYVSDYMQTRELNPDDIISIDILKDAAATAIFCNRGVNGVIIITTKINSIRKFIIKDFLNGNKIPFATVCFISKTGIIIMAVANDSGILVTDKLKSGLQYNVTVSSAGYKSFTTTTKGVEQQVLLEREEKEVPKPIYPNPVQRNNIFNIELESERNETMQLNIVSLNGTIISLQSQKISKGLNHLSITADTKWVAGIYNIQLRNDKGTVIKQEKLIVQ